MPVHAVKLKTSPVLACVADRRVPGATREGPAASECHLEIEIEAELAAAFSWRVRPGPATMREPAPAMCKVAQCPPALHVATVCPDGCNPPCCCEDAMQPCARAREFTDSSCGLVKMIAARQSTAQRVYHDRVSAPYSLLMHSRAQKNHQLILHGVCHHGAPRACLGRHRLR